MELMLFCESPFSASQRLHGGSWERGSLCYPCFPSFLFLSCMRKRWCSKADSLGIGEASSRNRKCTCGNTPIQEERWPRTAVERGVGRSGASVEDGAQPQESGKVPSVHSAYVRAFSSISLEALSIRSRLSGTLGESDSWRELSLAVGPREMILSSPSLTVLTWKVEQCSISPAELLLGESGVLPANC